MIGVHLGNEQRHVGHHPVVARVADDDVAGLGECAFDLAGDRRVEPENISFGALPGVAASTIVLRDVVGQAIGQPPGGGVAERLALRALAGAEPLHLEPRMVREKRDELLADHAGRAENADGYRCHDRDPTCRPGFSPGNAKKKPTRLNRVGR